MTGPKPPVWFVGDGCTFAPDRLFGHELTEACRYHDWAYRCDVPLSRWKADWYLFKNLRECGCHRRWAWYYWGAVRIFGRRFWNRKRSWE
jgi:hypothetical protein